MPDATPEFKQQLKRAFDSIEVGQIFTFRRTFTTGDVTLFCGVTGDYNPYHIDQTFIQESWFKQRALARRSLPFFRHGVRRFLAKVGRGRRGGLALARSHLTYIHFM
jgi:hypothetical protein